MKLVDVLHPDAVTVDLKSQGKEDIISELVDLFVKTGGVKKADKSKIVAKLNERETLGSTGIGKGIGIPHAKSKSVKKMAAAIGISKRGVDFKSLDGELTHIFFLLIAPGENPGPHLKCLAKISRLLDDKFIRDMLRSARTSQDVFKIVKTEEQKKTQ